MYRSYINSFALKGSKPSEKIKQILERREQDPALASLIQKAPGVWAVDPAMAAVLVNTVAITQPKVIVEFGAGSSSRLLAHALQKNGGGELYSIEQDPEWCSQIYTPLTQLSSVKANLVHSKVHFTLNRMGVIAMHDCKKRIAQLKQIDLVFVDGPQQYKGREGAMEMIFSNISPGALIILDDAARYTEKSAIVKWLKSYSGLQLEYYDPQFGQKGIAILSFEKNRKKTFSFDTFLIGLIQGGKRIFNKGKKTN